MADQKSSGNDDVKRKFREALERKKATENEHPQDGPDGSPEQGQEQSAKTKPTFRRKAV